MERKWIAALVMGITMLTGAAQAKDNPTRQCIADARAENNACTQVCKDDFLTAVDTCRNVNHDCADQARDARKACVSDVLTGLAQCVSDNCGMFKTLLEQCKADNPPGALRDACIDGVQVQNFQCRDQCRENVELFKSLKACRTEFRIDLKACAPATMPTVMGP